MERYYIKYYFTHPRETVAMATFIWRGGKKQLLNGVPENANGDWIWVYEKLIATSRSFSTLGLSLHEELRGPLSLFYIILRALDTIEDDMKRSKEHKKEELKEFYKHLNESGYKLNGYGAKVDEIELLQNFDRVVNCFQELKPKYQEIITDICREMGHGMAKYLDRPIITILDWDNYCHYVAGLVGHGLCRFSIASGLAEFPDFSKILTLDTQDCQGSYAVPPPELLRLANSTGLFLQKVNIIRDIAEDLKETPPRVFWPKEIWSKYVDDIMDLVPRKGIASGKHFDRKAKQKFKSNSLACLNELTVDAMRHIPDYLEGLRAYKSIGNPPDTTVYTSAGIVGVMALATFALCYNNYQVFLTCVKIPKGEALKILQTAESYKNILKLVIGYMKTIKGKALENVRKDPKDDCSKQLYDLMNEFIIRYQKELENQYKL